MKTEMMRDHVAKLSVETADQLTMRDIHELCDAAEEAIRAGGGFGWLSPPPKSVMEDYWRGVQMIPERYLIIARLDKVIAGSCQIVRPPKIMRHKNLRASSQHSLLPLGPVVMVWHK